MQDIFIGVDGGGTKSKVRIENSAGLVIGQGVGGPANIRLSVSQAWTSIRDALEEALRESGIELTNKQYRFHLGLGLAGCEDINALNAFLAYAHPFTTLQVVSDGHAACVGAHKVKDGAVIIVGTGTVGYQIQAGQGVKVSGWGFPHDDEGGGAWLGLEAVRLTFQWLDHRTERSPLAEDVFAFFNEDMNHFAAWANQANSSEFGRLAPLVINHSQQEEVAAVRLMKKAAHAVDRIHTALIKTQIDQCHSKIPLPCCLLGGIAPFVKPWLSEELRARLVPRQADASAGAILLVREHLAKQAEKMSET